MATISERIVELGLALAELLGGPELVVLPDPRGKPDHERDPRGELVFELRTWVKRRDQDRPNGGVLAEATTTSRHYLSRFQE